MYTKLMEQQIKFWHKCKRCPDNYLQKDTFLNWKRYIESNDKNCFDEIGNIHLNGATFNYVIKSPLSRCYRLLQSLYKQHQNILIEKEPSVMRPPSTYTTPFPTNIYSFSDENDILIKRMNENKNCFNFWTDGSCLPNPGPGGAGYFSNNFAISSKMFVIDHDTTINYAELIGIKLVLSSVLRYIEYVNNQNGKMNKNNINIYTDSQFVFNMLNKDGYPKLDYYYKLLLTIFDLCAHLKNASMNINIIKINSHKGNQGNQMADKIAREAANIARMCKFGDSKFIKYRLDKNPVNVDIAKDMIKLKKMLKTKRKNEWLDMKKDRLINNNKNRYYGGHIFEKMVINQNNQVNYNQNNDMRKELRFLNQKECEIITKLRTEFINLNHYLFTMGIINRENGYKCKHCNVPETVDHYLIDCPGVKEKMHQGLHKNNVDYNILRNKFKLVEN